MKESEYTLISDMASVRAAERVLSDIISPSKELAEIRLKLRALIARGQDNLAVVGKRGIQ